MAALAVALLADASAQELRYLLIGFADEPVYVFDVTEPARPKLLYGYSVLQINEESGVYLGHAGEPVSLLAIQDSAILNVRIARMP